MKKLILTALAGTAALGLAACDNDAAEPATDTTTDTTIVAPMPAPTATETTVVTDGTTPSDGSTVSVGPDGASASIDAGDTTVTADTNGNATMSTK